MSTHWSQGEAARVASSWIDPQLAEVQVGYTMWSWPAAPRAALRLWRHTDGQDLLGRAYQTWQVLTNAAREGARVSVLPNSSASAAESRVRDYMQSGQLSGYASASVSVNRSASIGGSGTASAVTVDYPFQFMMLQPVSNLVVAGTATGSPFTMRASAVMRNEAQ